MNLGVLVSGNLGLIVLKELGNKHRISFVLTDKKSLSIIEFCSANKIQYFAGNPRGAAVIEKLGNPPCDLVVSVNYLFLIERDIIDYPGMMAINFHGSLLPKYRGRTPHVWAIINNEKVTGITAHLIDTDCDAGDIIAQVQVPIEDEHTGQDVLNAFNRLYPDFVSGTIARIIAHDIKPARQDNAKATYFGKRTAEDGLIDWGWQKERIYNWVRAQAKPYPGAFSYSGPYKIVIHKVGFSDHGFHYETPNGKIIAVENGCPVVKTPNGCIRLIEFEYSSSLKVNDILK